MRVHYNRTQGSLRELEESMEKFLSLSSHTHDDDDKDYLQQLIYESLAAIEVAQIQSFLREPYGHKLMSMYTSIGYQSSKKESLRKKTP